MMKQVYLDYNASTPIAHQVTAVMREVTDQAYGNPSSGHWAGNPARQLVDKARGQVANLLGCSPSEIVFTSGGTEANNNALKGAFFASNSTRRHIITTRVEHPAILEPLNFLRKFGLEVTLLPVDRAGRIDPKDLQRAIRNDTILISVMHANNEVGTIQPIKECSAIAREHGIPFHTDAAQSVGKVATKVDDLGVDMLSIAGHKIYAPKGVGALYIRHGINLEPFMHGAGHENGRRAGTESALLTTALGEACALASDLSHVPQMRELRDKFWNDLQNSCGDRVAFNGHKDQRLPNTLNVSFVGRVGTDVLNALEGVAASTGSACHSGQIEMSPVLKAMALPEEVGMGAVRFSLGRGTNVEDIEAVVGQIVRFLG